MVAIAGAAGGVAGAGIRDVDADEGAEGLALSRERIPPAASRRGSSRRGRVVEPLLAFAEGEIVGAAGYEGVAAVEGGIAAVRRTS